MVLCQEDGHKEVGADLPMPEFEALWKGSASAAVRNIPVGFIAHTF